MTNQDKNNDNLTPSNQGKINKYSSDLIKKGLDLARSIQSENIDDVFESEEDLIEKIRYLYDTGNLEEALTLSEIALSKKWKVDELYELTLIYKARILTKLKKYEDALDSLDTVLNNSPFYNLNKTLYKEKARLLIYLSKYEEAIRIFSQVLKEDEKDKISWNLLGFAQVQLKLYQDALDSYNKSLDIDQDQWPVWLAKSEVYENLQMFSEQIFCLDKILYYTPNNLDILLKKGHLQRKIGNSNEAFECYSRIIEIDPDFLDKTNNDY